MAKNRLAPLKEMTLPRLELMAAVIGARLGNHLLKELKLTRAVFWGDIQIVLHWLKSLKKQVKFINNRTREIKELTFSHTWNYVPTECNPADLQTRGITLKEFNNNALWLERPNWLINKSNWPAWQCSESTILSVLDNERDSRSEEENGSANRDIQRSDIMNLIDIQKFSSYQKLLRVTSYVNRFVNNLKLKTDKRTKGPLTPEELNKSSMDWIMAVQQHAFTDVIDRLKLRKRNSLIRQLRLYIDSKQIIRCRGRIHNANISEETKFPILLPSKGTFTDILVSNAHSRNLHSGSEATVTLLRQKYWIPSIRQVVRKIVRKCVTCRKVIGKAYDAPDPPPLPSDRLNDNVPFAVTGVDYTGALRVKVANREDKKVYICLFTCASTRAVHLELVMDLSEESFLLAFRRFMSRKSTPQVMLSDNGSTFIAAAETLRRFTQSSHINDTLRKYGISWKFIPKRAPWYGGFWERLVGLTKTCINKVLGRSFVTLEQLSTVLTEAELILNDRPLTYVTSDINDPEPLTPAHLLYGRRITSLTYPDERPATNSFKEKSHIQLNKDVKGISDILQHFWSRCKREYLTSLREYQRASGSEKAKIKVGDVVQIHDDSKRIHWKLGVVEELITGKDGHVRAVNLRTSNGVTNRPITRLFPLEICAHDVRCSDRLRGKMS